MNIVINSKFNPFTYAELVKPLEDYTKAYNTVEEQYSNLVTQAEAFRNIANQEENSIAYSMFKGYMDDLESIVDDFSKGMTIRNRRPLLNMKRRYAKEITPIALADAERKKAIQYRRDAKAKDGSIRFKVENPSLDDYLNGNVVSDDYISGKDIMARTAGKSEALAKSLFSDPEFRTALNGQKIEVSQQNGMSASDFMAVINNNLNNPNISPALRAKLQGFRQILDDELNAVSDWGESAKRQVSESAISGMYAGLAKPTYNYENNLNYISAADSMQLGISARKLALDEQFNIERLKATRISSGQEAFYEDKANHIKYYSDGTSQWSEKQKVDASGNRVWYRSDTGEVTSGSLTDAQMYQYGYEPVMVANGVPTPIKKGKSNTESNPEELKGVTDEMEESAGL